MRAIRICDHDLQDIARHETVGQYGYPIGEAVLEITGGKLKGRKVYESYGFAWRGNTGGLRVERSLIPAGREEEIIARVNTPLPAEEAIPLQYVAAEWVDVLTL